MGRIRQYSSAAERQKAYRQRLAAGPPEPQPERARGRPKSRLARLADLESAARQLHEDYQNWLESIPESLQDSRQAELLGETVEQLETVVDILSEIQPLRGFGRD